MITVPSADNISSAWTIPLANRVARCDSTENVDEDRFDLWVTKG